MPHVPRMTSNINRRDRTAAPRTDLELKRVRKFTKPKKKSSSRTKQFKPF